MIEEDHENAKQKLQQIINRKATKDNKPDNLNVVRDKTYDRPVERANHRYPTRNVIQQVQVETKATESQKIQEKTKSSVNTPHIGQYEQENMASIPPS